jgi:putative NADH-flavin reductase
VQIAVLGASGATGQMVVTSLLERGDDVAVLVRNPARLGVLAAKVRVVTGDAADPAALKAAMDGADAVVSLVGVPRGERIGTARSDAARIMVETLTAAGPRRLVVVTALGGSASIGQLGLLGRIIYRRVIGKERLVEVDRQESLISSSPLDWTLVRPPRLVDGAPSGYRVAGSGRLASGITLTRADLAAALVDEAVSQAHVRQAVTLHSA